MVDVAWTCWSLGCQQVSSHALNCCLYSIDFRTPGAHGNDITMSEKADAACPDEFSAWTMSCAGKQFTQMLKLILQSSSWLL